MCWRVCRFDEDEAALAVRGFPSRLRLSLQRLPADAGLPLAFSINPSTAVLSTVAPLNFEVTSNDSFMIFVAGTPHGTVGVWVCGGPWFCRRRCRCGV